MELNDKTYHKILVLCDKGDQFVENEQYDKAIKNYVEALNLLPDPKTEWEASTWIYTALGDAFFLKNELKEAKDYFYNALNCPDGITNPFILLRTGQCLFECGELEKAKEYLLKAFMLEGYQIFHDENEKYINHIIDLI